MAKASSTTCRKYLRGKCQHGCRYKHPPVCRDHLRGKCTRNCKYAYFTDPALFEYHLRLLEIEKEEKEEKERRKIEKKNIKGKRNHGDVCIE